jgi:hypothetical protein
MREALRLKKRLPKPRSIYGISINSAKFCGYKSSAIKERKSLKAPKSSFTFISRPEMEHSRQASSESSPEFVPAMPGTLILADYAAQEDVMNHFN